MQTESIACPDGRVASQGRLPRKGRHAGMLVLTRKLRESITIGDSIRITVVDIRGRQVKLAIEAPREIAVHRTEIFERIQRENGGETTGHISPPGSHGRGGRHLPERGPK